MLVKIEIPDNCRCLLKPGSTIDLGVPFLEKKIDQLIDVFVARDIKIQPKKIFQYLIKFVGDEVKKGQIIAFKKDLFGQKKLLSPVDGIIKEIDHELGKVIIAVVQKEKKSIGSYFKGEVTYLKSDHFELEIGKGDEFNLKKTTKNFGGKIFFLDEKNVYRLSSTDINERVIITGLVSDLVLSKIEVLGGVGLITSKDYSNDISIPFAQIKDLDQLKTIITKKLPYCLILKQFSKIYLYS